MLTTLTRFVSVVLLLSVMNTGAALYAADNVDDPKAVAKRFLKAFADADVEKMQQHFADQVLFHGEPRFIGRAKLDKPTELTKRQLSDAYAKLFKRVGREKWNQLFKKTKPTLTKATADGKPIHLAKKGDYVYDLHFREATKGKRAGLDEAVIFVFRKVDNKYRIVAHFADY